MWGQRRGKQLYISSVKIWRCLTVLSSLSGASTAYHHHHHHFQVLSCHFYRSWQQCGETEKRSRRVQMKDRKNDRVLLCICFFSTWRKTEVYGWIKPNVQPILIEHLEAGQNRAILPESKNTISLTGCFGYWILYTGNWDYILGSLTKSCYNN